MAMDDDVVMRKILWRVPMKPLVRLKCVSKHWYALITALQNQNKVLLKREVEKESGEIETRFSILSYPFHDDGDEFCIEPALDFAVIHGSSHGIVCLSDDYSHLFLYNPASRELPKLHSFQFKQGCWTRTKILVLLVLLLLKMMVRLSFSISTISQTIGNKYVDNNFFLIFSFIKHVLIVPTSDIKCVV